MARRVTIKAGSSTVILPKNLMSTFENVLEKIIPETKKELSEILDKVEQEARAEWPIRRRKDGSKHPKSQNSKGKIYSELIVTTDFKVIARIGCSADYAFAIKVGARTKIDLPLGRRVSNELLWKPIKKQTNRVVDTLKNETTKLMKK